MSLTVTNIFSSLGNNSTSLLPVAIKDGVENAGRTAMAYKNGGETRTLEARERFIEGSATSAVWLGGIPLLRKVFDKTVFKMAGYDPKIDLKYLTNKGAQSLEKVAEKAKGADKEAFKKVLDNPKTYKALHISKTVVSTAIPLIVLTKFLPKWIYSITNNVINKKAKNPEFDSDTFIRKEYFDKNFKGSNDLIRKKTQEDLNFRAFTRKDAQNSEVSFKGIKDILNPLAAAQAAQHSPLSNMVILDAGISGSRIVNEELRERKANEGKKNDHPHAAALETAIREGGIMYFMYVGGNHLAKLIESVSEKLLKTPINLDPKVLEGKSFAEAIKNKTPIKSLADMGEEEMLNFIDNNLKDGKFSDITLKYAEKTKLISTKNGERNLFKFVDVDKIKELNKNMIQFAETAEKSADPEKFLNKAKVVKRAGIIGNIATSVLFVSVIIPKIMYAFRQKYTGSKEQPGIKAVEGKANRLAEQKKLG